MKRQGRTAAGLFGHSDLVRERTWLVPVVEVAGSSLTNVVAESAMTPESFIGWLIVGAGSMATKCVRSDRRGPAAPPAVPCLGTSRA